MPATPVHQVPQFRPAAALAGWVLPGLGHILAGQRRRGVLLMLVIGSLWLAGLLIGGVSVVDHKHNAAWFLGQMLLAPSWAVDAAHQQLRGDTIAGQPPPPPDDQGARVIYEPSLGRVREQGVLYTALAGLLNLLAILDVLYRGPESSAEDKPAPHRPAGGAA